jgi:sugar O-acyltransferase (sialic acid O-acetyltransferase NeuD family)
MESVVAFGIGSSILVDIEESIYRAEVVLTAAIQNYPGKNFLSNEIPIFTPESITNNIRNLPYIVPLFTPGNRQKATLEAQALGFKLAFSLIDSTVVTPRSLTIEPGVYINSGCSLGASSYFDKFVFINRGASIGHHAYFNRFVSIGPGVIIAGNVSIGKGAMIGAGAVILPKVTIGENTVIGAGAVVTKNAPSHCLLVGNPARIIKDDMPGYNNLTVY